MKAATVRTARRERNHSGCQPGAVEEGMQRTAGDFYDDSEKVQGDRQQGMNYEGARGEIMNYEG